MLTDSGHVKIIDFDAARLKKADSDKDTRLIGTDGFAPPEQYGFMQTDERSDIYAFGVTMKLLLGERYNSSLYRAVAEKCMRFDPQKRYPDIISVKNAIKMRRALPLLLGISSVSVLIMCLAIWIVNNAVSEIPVSSEPINSTQTTDITTTYITTTAPVTIASETTAHTTTTALVTIPSETTAHTTTTAPVTITPETTINTTTTAPVTITPETTINTTVPVTTPPETTTVTNTTTQSPVEEPEIIESVRNTPWEVLIIPDEMPKLTDYVSTCSVSTRVKICEYTWDGMSFKETYEVLDKLLEWAGVSEYEHNQNADGSDDFIITNDTMSIRLSNKGAVNHYKAKLEITSQNGHIFNYGTETGYMSKTEQNKPKDSIRNIAWDDLSVLPEGFPHFTDAISGYEFEEDNNQNYTGLLYLYWDKFDLMDAASYMFILYEYCAMNNGCRSIELEVDEKGVCNWHIVDASYKSVQVLWYPYPYKIGVEDRQLTVAYEFM